LRRQLEELAIEQVQARANLERERNLLAEGLIPPARLQLSETRLAVLQATERARLAELASSGLTDPDVDASSLAHGWLRSPMRGQLIEANVLPGQSNYSYHLICLWTRQVNFELVIVLGFRVVVAAERSLALVERFMRDSKLD
jgi:hypothetical protein